jgi:putative MATE family efflux protein
VRPGVHCFCPTVFRDAGGLRPFIVCLFHFESESRMSFNENVSTAVSPQHKIKRQGIFSTLREAVLGSEQDFTEGSINRAIVMLAVPMMLEMVLESLFAVVNIFYVAHWLGTNETAAVGLTESLLTLVFTVAMGLSMGATATVARRIGEKNTEGASQAAAQAILLGVIASLPVALIGLFFMPTIMRLMNAPESVIAAGSGYGTIIFAGNVTIMLLFLINAVFRGAGDASLAMRSLWLANIVNFILDPLFIFGLGLGVTGSAIATTIGRGVGVAFQLWILLGGRGRVKVGLHQFRPDWPLMWQMFRLSLNVMFQYAVATASWVVMARFVARFGGAALAGYTLAVRIIIFAILPSWGISNAAATLTGQNLGAGKPERAERSVWITGFWNMVFLGLVAIVFIVFAEPVVRFFVREDEVVPYAVACLRYICYGYPFYAWGMVIVQSLNGAGDTFLPTTLNLLCYWLIQIPLAWALAIPVGMGTTGIFLAITIAESLLAVIGVFAFKRGRWKERKV